MQGRASQIWKYILRPFQGIFIAIKKFREQENAHNNNKKQVKRKKEFVFYYNDFSFFFFILLDFYAFCAGQTHLRPQQSEEDDTIRGQQQRGLLEK